MDLSPFLYGYCLGALQRKGAITGMARGPQTKARAIFQGLLTLAQYIHTNTGDCPGQFGLGSLDESGQAERLPRPGSGPTSRVFYSDHTPVHPHEPQDP